MIGEIHDPLHARSLLREFGIIPTQVGIPIEFFGKLALVNARNGQTMDIIDLATVLCVANPFS
jgi:hypothetical protein